MWDSAFRSGAVLGATLLLASSAVTGQQGTAMTYRRFEVVEEGGRVAATRPIASDPAPTWAAGVAQEPFDWDAARDARQVGRLLDPIPFVVPPDEGSEEPFFSHNHQPSITWCANGDLLAIWYTTEAEQDPMLTVVASRLRAGADRWDPAAEFFKAENRNMHGSAIFHDGEGTLHHANGMGPDGGRGWSRLALLHRTSADHGVTWTAARPVSSGANYAKRHQVIAGMIRTTDGRLVLACDATPGGEGPSAIHVSSDRGATWTDPGGDIRGIHAGVVERRDGSLLAFGRAQALDGRMPRSVSTDDGATWAYAPTPFPPIRSGQRLVLLRLAEGPLMLVSFADDGIAVVDDAGEEFLGQGLFAALSDDDGETWPVCRLLTPGSGDFDGGAHTRKFTATPTRAEPAGYLAATQTPDGVVHLISSRLHYRFDVDWLRGGR